MRLLKRSPAGELDLITFDNESPPRYAILSHTWNDGQEVTYQELLAGTGKDKEGYSKIEFCVNRAAQDGIEYSWVDTCCIDKSTNNELSTAINSMFRWYERAAKCYVYLADITLPEEVKDGQSSRTIWSHAFSRSLWFTRGWTVQELLAPATVEFFSRNGKFLGTKISLEQEIHQLTEIPLSALRGQRLSEFSVEERMSWASKRKTTLKEDSVYCLLGIFGVFLPLIYGEGETYAAMRLREEISKRQHMEGENRLGGLIVDSSLPFPRNENFVGREEQLKTIKESLLVPSGHRRMTIYGLGGCGKSALALEFAYRSLTQNPTLRIFWVPALSQESFELAYKEIGVRLGIPEINVDNMDVKLLVKNKLSSSSTGPWMLIVDNADDPAVLLGKIGGKPGSDRLLDALPFSSNGKVLFTTRSRKVAGDLSQRNILGLSDMSKVEARQLLKGRVSNGELIDDNDASYKLLELLEYLPLAIVQAAAFISNNDVSVSEYIDLFQTKGTEAEVFSEHFEDPTRYREMESTIAKTWYISFEQIRKQDPLAADYLSFMACIDRINIPQSLLPPSGSRLQHVKAIGTLKGYAFISERQQASHNPSSEKSFDMHRLVHMASVTWLDSQDAKETWAIKAVDWLENEIPFGGLHGKDVWTLYLPHAIYLAAQEGTLDEARRASLLERVGRCQYSLGQFSMAEVTHRQALYLRKHMLGHEHEFTVQSMGEVGVALEAQGKYDEAEAMTRAALALSEKVLGDEHPNTIKAMGDLATILHRQRKLSESEKMSERGLACSIKTLGPKHPDTLAKSGNLVLNLDLQGRGKEAEELNRKTLASLQEVFGPDHPYTLMSMSNLALVLCNQGKHREAETILRDTQERRVRILGPKHPDVLQSQGTLAVVLEHLGRFVEAEIMFKETLLLLEEVLGRRHPYTLIILIRVGRALYRQEKYEEAEKISREAVRGQSVLGPTHPDALMGLENLACTLSCLGRLEEAEAMHRESLARHEEVLGPRHPNAILSKANLANTLSSKGKYEESDRLAEEALALMKEVLGIEHPSTLRSMRQYSWMLQRQGKLDEAEEVMRQTAAHQEEVLGREHLDTQKTLDSLAALLEQKASLKGIEQGEDKGEGESVEVEAESKETPPQT